MGQQQLLLLVLGIVIVGLAVVVGIQAFSENQQKANADAMVNDGVRIGSDIQAWALKPQAFGGPKDTEDLGDVTFGDIGYNFDSTTNKYENLNGEYLLTGTAAASCVLISGESLDGAAADADAGTDAVDASNVIYIKITGTGPSDIETAVNPASALAC